MLAWSTMLSLCYDGAGTLPKFSLMHSIHLLWGSPQVTTRWAKEEPKPEQRARLKFRRIFLKGADNPGLVYNVAEYLAGNKINIENLETATEEAPFGGTTLFTMEGVIAMPLDMPTQVCFQSSHHIHTSVLHAERVRRPLLPICLPNLGLKACLA